MTTHELTIKLGETNVSSEMVETMLQEENSLLLTKPLPEGIKFIDRRGASLVVVHQQPPIVRNLRWIHPDSPYDYGDGTTYTHYRVSVPWSVIVAGFKINKANATLEFSELYFRNHGIHAINDELYYPSLLNISVLNNSHAWICTQYLGNKRGSWMDVLQKLHNHCWNGGFNYSSEHHEGLSWFSRYNDCDAVYPIENWVQKSKQDACYGTKVAWKKAPFRLNQLIDYFHDRLGYSRPSLAVRLRRYAIQR